jgi:hypothetical protein
MFLDCPAYLDQDGARRCGLPAEVRRRFIMRSSDGPLEAAMIRCPSGHWFNGPIESLTWESEEKHHPGRAGAASSATRSREGLHDGSPDRPTAHSPAAPAYYLGRPAHMWITAMSPRCRPQARPIYLRFPVILMKHMRTFGTYGPIGRVRRG